MVRALELAVAGELRSAVPLASPVLHRRDHHDRADARKEG